MTTRRPPAPRRIHGNRTLNLRSIRAIGYDMDYTLIHYRVEEWERSAFEHTRERLRAAGWPVEDMVFDPESVIRGLTIDLELGNLVKPTRFGYVIRASHGTQFLEFDRLRSEYEAVTVDLAEDRWVFLNTLFSLSEASLYAQLVDRYDAGVLPKINGYADLYKRIRSALDAAHMEGQLKEEILADPDRFVVPDPEVVLTLLDQKHAGKRLLLITNSDWNYAKPIMTYAFDPHLPEGTTWRDLFDAIVVSAEKPTYFMGRRPMYRIVDEESGLLEPHRGTVDPGTVLVGGDAIQMETHLGLHGAEILYVGDHLYADVSVTKATLRWRTALILRELESEIEAAQAFRAREARLQALMGTKGRLERELAHARLDLLRARAGYAAADGDADTADARAEEIRGRLSALDDEITPLAIAAGELRNPAWGPLMRSGNDKSLFARQVERYADVYTSRVSNFLRATPFGFLRAARVNLPHDG
jgi:HAD superfamily 5'-nucleotidase-like hydrolase